MDGLLQGVFEFGLRTTRNQRKGSISVTVHVASAMKRERSSRAQNEEQLSKTLRKTLR